MAVGWDPANPALRIVISLKNIPNGGEPVMITPFGASFAEVAQGTA